MAIFNGRNKAVSLITLTTLSTVVSMAQAKEDSLRLEEITVTAQKREQSLQDVPIAISVVSGESLRNNNVVNLQDLSGSMPGLHVTESFVGDSIFVRGLGSGQNNLGFEQAVGRVVDGYFYGRSRFSRIAFLDIERVELLKGPQGALIGKNTTAGAINITTAKPTDSFEGWVSASYEFEADTGTTVETGISGPLTENLNGRVAVKYLDRDGYIKNTFTGEDDVSKEELVGRVSLAWAAADNVDVLFQYQYGSIEHDGGNNQYSLCDTTTDQSPVPGFQSVTGAIVGAFGDDCQANYRRAASAARNGVDVEGKETDLDTYSLTVDWQLGEHTLTSLTGFANYEYVDLQDGDRSPAESTLAEFAEDYEQWTQEIRLVSPQGDRFDYIAGLYFMEREQQTDYRVHLNVPAPVLAASRNIFTQEDASTAAIFGQFTAHLNSQWDLTLGGRYTYEEKEGASVQYPSDLYADNPQVVCINPIPGVCSAHDIKDDFDEENFSPVINLQWRPSSSAMYYASIRRGFKAGGFDHNLVADDADADIMQRFRFDSEEVLSYELGAKLTLADGAAQLNGAIFRSDFEDLQLSGFLDSVSIANTVTNAAEATSQGAEMDITWQATSGLRLFASFAYVDSTYSDYEDAPCYTLQVLGCVNGRQDLSDRDLQFTSDWKATASAEYLWQLNNGMSLTGFVQLNYVDEFPLQADLDPKLYQDEYVKVDARLTLSSNDDRWSISLVGRNLDNETTTSYGDDVPAQAGTVWRSVDAPRSFTVQATVNF